MNVKGPALFSREKKNGSGALQADSSNSGQLTGLPEGQSKKRN